MTYSHWIQCAQTRLQHHDDARLLARRLLDFATGLQFAHLMAPDDELSASALAQLNAQLSRLEAGEPLPYVLGIAPFFGRNWRVEAGVLIPRPETELLVEAVLQLPENAARVVELGAGSGIVAGTLALERTDWTVFATELSPMAREVAARNFADFGARVELLCGRDNDWLGPIQSLAPLDCIASNPPYIASGAIATLQSSVRDFEPRLALDGGTDGLNPYRQIAAGARDLLGDGGFVALEIGHEQRGAIEKLFAGWRRLEWKMDFQNIARTVVVWR